MMRWRMIRNTVVTAKKYTVGNVPPPQKIFPSYSTGLESGYQNCANNVSSHKKHKNPTINENVCSLNVRLYSCKSPFTNNSFSCIVKYLAKNYV